MQIILKKYIFIVKSHFALAFGWQNLSIFSIFLSFFLMAIAFFVIKKYRVKSPIFSLKLCFFALVCYPMSLRFLLLLAGDIHPNPGPLRGKLRLGHWNLNSLLTRNKSKISLIEALQATENFDLFGISETFLNDKTKKNDLEIHGFFQNPLRADCPDANNHPKGGVCLYYRENLPLKHRKDLQLLDETIVCEIKLDRNKKLFFILCYRSPSQDHAQTNKPFSKIWKKNSLILKKKTPPSLCCQGT